MTSKSMRKICVLAGLSVMATVASALPVDAQIVIDRALNSPTLTVRYSGANAALVELRLNGESVGTRSVVAAKANGETNFNINLNELKDGDNEVEVRLFDRTGKLVGTEKTNISTDQTQYGPVFLRTPKLGATVQGNVEINLGFGRELKNVYVSFFVDNNFKKMSNYPPYTFQWDTTGESNGWHEVEAWAIDETSNTYKTRKTRVFVNNPGGRTERKGVGAELVPTKNPFRSGVTGEAAGIKSVNIATNAKAATTAATGLVPKAAAVLAANRVQATSVAGMSGLKPMATGGGVATGAKSLTPTGTRVALVGTPVKATKATAKAASAGTVTVATIQKVSAPKLSTVNDVTTAANVVRILKGQRVPNLATYSVVFNSQFVEFDVNPRVDDGVPMAPVRHLLEKAGGEVGWENLTKTVKAKADGKDIVIQIGDKTARIANVAVLLENAPYLDRGRTIVPLSFLRDALQVEIEYDKETGHVLITSLKK